MKVLIVVCALACVATADFVIKKPTDLLEARTKCFKEVGLSEKFIEEIKKFNYPNDPMVHKYMLCSSKELGFFDEKTGYNGEYLLEQFGKDQDKTKLKPIIEKCIDRNEMKTTTEEWAWRNYKCMVDAGLLKSVKDSVGKKE